MQPPDWSRWENHVLAEIKRGNDNDERILRSVEELKKMYYDLKDQVTTIKVRIAVWSGLFGFMASGVIPLFKWLFMKGD